MRTLPLVSVFVCLAVTTVRAAIDPAAILSPRPSGWVVDQARVLSTEEVAELNRLGDAVHARDGAEMAIVVVSTIGGGDHRDFATRLFNHWQIGDRARDNGLLLFVAVGDRASEIILGDGIDSDTEVARSDRVMQGEMLPRFRRGDNAGAIMAGARACARDLFGAVLASAPAPDPATTLVEAPTAPAPTRSVPKPKPAQPERRAPSSPSVDVPTPVVVGGAGGLGLVAWLGGRAWLRRRPRRCGRCSMTMGRLEEAADDAHLAASERVEERLGSVDYDVWLCPGCGAVEKIRHGTWFTRYSRCRQCGSVTTSKARTTLLHATTSSTGLVEIHEHCEHCGFSHTYTQTTPRVSSSSSSGRSSSGFGGGSSSGRGSSGKW